MRRSAFLILVGTVLLLSFLTHVDGGISKEVIAVNLAGTITRASAESVVEAVQAADRLMLKQF